MEGTGKFVSVAKKSDIAAGTGVTVDVEGKAIALFNVGGKFYAIDNTCVHRGGPLGEGSVEGTEVTCPWHGWTYDVSSGQCTMNPQAKVACHSVKEEGENILVSV